jgi:hypothetical protein
MTAQEYRVRAEQCLRIARGAVRYDVAETLRRLADEFEREAEREEQLLETEPA